MCEICSKLRIKRHQNGCWCRSGVFIVNFEQMSDTVLVFPLLLWTSKCWLSRFKVTLSCDSLLHKQVKVITQRSNASNMFPIKTAKKKRPMLLQWRKFYSNEKANITKRSKLEINWPINQDSWFIFRTSSCIKQLWHEKLPISFYINFTENNKNE